jgi:hypothetical protein
MAAADGGRSGDGLEKNESNARSKKTPRPKLFQVKMRLLGESADHASTMERPAREARRAAVWRRRMVGDPAACGNKMNQTLDRNKPTSKALSDQDKFFGEGRSMLREGSGQPGPPGGRPYCGGRLEAIRRRTEKKLNQTLDPITPPRPKRFRIKIGFSGRGRTTLRWGSGRPGRPGGRPSSPGQWRPQSAQSASRKS